MEALYDPTTNLTYTARTGARKQSISNVDWLFSKKMEEFMTSKGYTCSLEPKFIQVMLNWRRTRDERGLSSDEWMSFHNAFLDSHAMALRERS